MVSLKLVIFLGVFGSIVYGIPLEDASANYEGFFPRIVGGKDAPHAGYVVALIFGIVFKGFMCGGAILSERIVGTAAHCVDPMRNWDGGLIESFRINAGSNQWNKGGVVGHIKDYVIHPEYNFITIKNDLALLIMRPDFKLNHDMSIIPLNFENIGGDVPCSVSGWGNLQWGGATPNVLQYLSLKTLSSLQCKYEVKKASAAWGSRLSYDAKSEICALNVNGLGFGMCHGDSGSPLVLYSKKVIGFVSWGFPCANGIPDMFVRVSSFKSFFQKHMNAHKP